MDVVIRVKMMQRSEVCIIEDLRVMQFDSSGTFIKERMIEPRLTEGMIELPIISVLSNNGVCEVALFHSGGKMEKFETSLDAMTCALTLQKNGGFVRMLRRDGKEHQVRYNQLILIYPEGTDLNGKVYNIGRKA